MLSSAVGPVEINPAKLNAVPGSGLELFGFIPDSVFTFIPDHCSESSRIGVRHHPGIAFTFPRNPQLSNVTASSSPGKARWNCST